MDVEEMVMRRILEEKDEFIAHMAGFPFMQIKTSEDDPYLWKITVLHPTPLAVESHGNYSGAFYGVQVEFSLTFPRDFQRHPFPVTFDSTWMQRTTEWLESASWNTGKMQLFALRAVQHDEAVARLEIERGCVQYLEQQTIPYLRYEALLANAGSTNRLAVAPASGSPISVAVNGEHTVGDLKHQVMYKRGR